MNCCHIISPVTFINVFDVIAHTIYPSAKCVVIRPNEGKKTHTKSRVLNNLLNGDTNLSRCTDIQKAMETWDHEFKLADRPSSESYQLYCYGRHTERIVWSGSIGEFLASSQCHCFYSPR